MSETTLRTFSLLAIAAFPLTGAAARQEPASRPAGGALTAEEILKRTAEVYASCDTYRDKGVSATSGAGAPRWEWAPRLHPHSHRWSDHETFETVFSGPDRIRFQVSHEQALKKDTREVIWGRSSRAQAWRSWGPHAIVDEHESVARALLAAKKRTRGVSTIVPALLLPEQFHSSPLALDRPERLSDATWAGREHLRVRGRDASVSVTVWIDKDSGLLRRFEVTDSEPYSTIEQSIVFEPQVGSPVSDEELTFERPEPSATSPSSR